MAGMLPGVEVARRRRFHLSGAVGTFDSPSPSYSSVNSSTRRSSFCLYPSNHESHLSSISTMQRNPVIDAYGNDQNLVDAAREAKKRLDGRLRAQWKSETKRVLRNSSQRSRDELETRPIEQEREVEVTQTAEICDLKKIGSKRFSWPKFGWKTYEQDECAVCLEKYKVGENLMQLQCGHRYHSRCLVPWLENNSHCPCCRMELV